MWVINVSDVPLAHMANIYLSNSGSVCHEKFSNPVSIKKVFNS